MRSFILSSVFLWFVGWADTRTLRRADRVCNNSPLLCSKPYDTITYLGAHDSPFLRNAATGFSSFGNQFFNTTVQLRAGVRLLTAQVHVTSKLGKRELHVCHTACGLFDAGPLKDWLLEIRLWMDANPYDIVTIILVNAGGVDARELEGVYSQADIAHYGYVPPNIDKPPPLSNDTNPTWPTLDQMIDKNTRLVSFVQPLKPDKENAPYLLNEFDFVWENEYMVTSSSGFGCSPDRPANQTISGMHQSGRLFLMNHLLLWQQAFGIQVPDIRNVNVTNSWDGQGSLGAHMKDCSNQVTQEATYVLVDFFNVGRAIRVVDIFNKVLDPVGRLNVTSNVVPGGAGLWSSDSAAWSRKAPLLGLGAALLAVAFQIY